MKEKVALYLFIFGCLLVILALILKQYDILNDYTLVYLGVIIESVSVLIYAYQKIKKTK